jgi:hypothetical protein
VANALLNAPFDLPLDSGGIDGLANLVDSDDMYDIDSPRFGVHLYLSKVGSK